MLRPLGFGGGGAVFLLLLYLLYSCYVLKISHKFDAENTTEPVSARNQSEVLSENTAEPVSTGTQSEVPVEAVPPAEAYSIEPLVSNTTLGVSITHGHSFDKDSHEPVRRNTSSQLALPHGSA